MGPEQKRLFFCKSLNLEADLRPVEAELPLSSHRGPPDEVLCQTRTACWCRCQPGSATCSKKVRKKTHYRFSQKSEASVQSPPRGWLDRVSDSALRLATKILVFPHRMTSMCPFFAARCSGDTPLGSEGFGSNMAAHMLLLSRSCTTCRKACGHDWMAKTSEIHPCHVLEQGWLVGIKVCLKW